MTTSYFTFREASEITGLNEATIRRLSKRPESKPYVQLKKGKKGSVYAIQADYLFGIYPRLKLENNPIYLRIGQDQTNTTSVGSQETAPLLAAKDELIQYLKNEIIHLRNENLTFQKEIHELKLRSGNAKAIQWPKKIIHWAAEFWNNIARVKRTDPYDELS